MPENSMKRVIDITSTASHQTATAVNFIGEVSLWPDFHLADIVERYY